MARLPTPLAPLVGRLTDAGFVSRYGVQHRPLADGATGIVGLNTATKHRVQGLGPQAMNVGS